MNKRKWLVNFILLISMVVVCFMASGSYGTACATSTVTLGDQTFSNAAINVWVHDEDLPTVQAKMPKDNDTMSNVNIYVCFGDPVEIPVTVYIDQLDPAVLAENYFVVVDGTSYPTTLTTFNGNAALAAEFTIPFTAEAGKTYYTVNFSGKYEDENGPQTAFSDISILLHSVSEFPCDNCTSFYDDEGILEHRNCSGCGAVCTGSGFTHGSCAVCGGPCVGDYYDHKSCTKCGAPCFGSAINHAEDCVTLIETTTIYFNNAEGWENVYAFFWQAGSASEEVAPEIDVVPNPFDNITTQPFTIDYGSYYTSTFTDWPGEKMTHVQGTIYSVEVPVTANRILFNNGGVNKTDDLTLPTNGSDLYINDKWSTMLKITKQPENAAARTGEAIETSVEAQGIGLKYQWYLKNEDDATFGPSNTKTKIYRLTMTNARANRQVYCVITDTYGNSVTSEIALLERTATPLEIITQPSADTAVKQGENYKVTVEAKGDNLKYQWYLKNANSTEFVPSAVTSKSYSITMTDKRAGREIYCVITDAYGNTVESEHVFVNRLRTDLAITQQPVGVEVAMGEAVRVSVDAVGDGLKYQWYISNDGGNTFGPSATTSKIYSLTMTKARANRQIYCVITDAYGETIQSDTVTLSVLNP